MRGLAKLFKRNGVGLPPTSIVTDDGGRRFEVAPAGAVAQEAWARYVAVAAATRDAIVIPAAMAEGRNPADGWRLNVDNMTWQREVRP